MTENERLLMHLVRDARKPQDVIERFVDLITPPKASQTTRDRNRRFSEALVEAHKRVTEAVQGADNQTRPVESHSTP